MSKALERVLVVRRGGLGDTLLMTAALRALRRLHPDSRLCFAGVREFAAVLARHRVVDEALSSEDLGHWRGAPSPALAAYELVIADDAAVAAAAPAGTRVQVFDPRPRDQRPMALQLAAAIGVEVRWPDDARLRPLPARDAAGSGAVVFAPGSGGRSKCWPRERWLALAARLPADRPLQVVVGPAEIERDDPRRWPWPRVAGRGVDFVVEAEAAMLAARIEGAFAFAGNDSGTTHLAAMLGVPTVALFGGGAGDPSVWAPPFAHVTVVRGEASGMATIPVEAVAAALHAIVDQGSRARTRSQ